MILLDVKIYSIKFHSKSSSNLVNHQNLPISVRNKNLVCVLGMCFTNEHAAGFFEGWFVNL